MYLCALFLGRCICDMCILYDVWFHSDIISASFFFINVIDILLFYSFVLMNVYVNVCMYSENASTIYWTESFACLESTFISCLLNHCVSVGYISRVWVFVFFCLYSCLCTSILSSILRVVSTVLFGAVLTLAFRTLHLLRYIPGFTF